MTSRLPACFLVLAALPACGDLTDVPAQVTNVGYRPDGQLVVATTGGIKVYQGDFASETASIRIEPNWYTAAYLSDDGRVAAITYFESNRTSFYGVPDGLPLGMLQPVPSVPFLVLSPRGDRAYAFGGHQGDNDPKPTEIQTLYNLADGSELWSLDYLRQFSPAVYCQQATEMMAPPVFTPDGATMYLAFGEHVVIADAATGVMHEIANARACIGGLTLLSDGSLLVLRGFVGRAFTGYPGLNGAPVTDPTLPDAPLPNSFAIYARDGSLVREIAAFPGFYTPSTIWGDATQVACSPVGDRCAMVAEKPEVGPGGTFTEAGGARYLLVWSLDGTLLYTLDSPTWGKLAFSPDGSRLAVGHSYSGDVVPSSARIYAVADGTLLAERSYTNGVF